MVNYATDVMQKFLEIVGGTWLLGTPPMQNECALLVISRQHKSESVLYCGKLCYSLSSWVLFRSQPCDVFPVGMASLDNSVVIVTATSSFLLVLLQVCFQCVSLHVRLEPVNLLLVWNQPASSA